jgi:tripartite-type tricarboxylate transporter receptor subunit TctC
MELFKSVAGFDAVHIPFNGSPPAVKSTVQNETQMLFAVMQPLQPQIQAGTLRALAVTTAKRFPLLPDLPTIAESGYPGFEALAWNGVLVPAATPKPIIAKLNTEMNAVLKEPDVVSKMHNLGFDLVGGTPEAFGELIHGEAVKWAPVIKKLGLKVD